MLRRGGKDLRIVSAMSGAELPAQLTPMVGRRRELGQIGALLDRDSVRLLTLVGPGGGGKTRLAIAVAEAWRARHGSRLFFVSLATIEDPGLVADAVAQALGLQARVPEPTEQRLSRYLCGAPSLLVLDNFEQVADAASLCVQLLSACASLKVLVTSTTPLRVQAEHRYEVLPLAVDFESTAGLEELAENDAV